MSLPTITVVGELKYIETKHLPSGKQLTSFQVSCSEKNIKGEWENLYLKGEVWGKSSEFVSKYFNNGSVAVVTGKLYTNTYDKNGTKVYENKLLFPQVSFLPKDKSENRNNTQPQQQQYRKADDTPQQYTQPTVDIDGEIPF